MVSTPVLGDDGGHEGRGHLSVVRLVGHQHQVDERVGVGRELRLALRSRVDGIHVGCHLKLDSALEPFLVGRVHAASGVVHDYCGHGALLFQDGSAVILATRTCR